jgi:hypothetical protein
MAVASPPFSGFSPEAIQFLANLAANNDRDKSPHHDKPRIVQSQEQSTWL